MRIADVTNFEVRSLIVSPIRSGLPHLRLLGRYSWDEREDVQQYIFFFKYEGAEHTALLKVQCLHFEPFCDPRNRSDAGFTLKQENLTTDRTQDYG